MKSRQERIERIRQVTKTANEDDTVKNYYTIKNWRGKPLYRKVVQIDSEYLMFRIENSRTEIQQLAYIRKHSLSKDFFEDPESPRVQQAQEEILTDMVKSKGRDLLEDLRLRKQDDACIITYDGYLVNGNRRTAGLKYLDERYIDCVVLPEDATPKDIYMLEQQLQIAEDFREEYHWINELRNIRKGMQDTRLEFTDTELASNLRLELKDVRSMLRTLDLIDAFLLWKNIPGEYDYSKLDDAQEIFGQLEKGIKKYARDPNKRSSLQNSVFTLIENRPAKGRLYGYVTDLIRNFDQVYEKLVKKDEPKDKNKNIKATEHADVLLDDLIDNDLNDEILFENKDEIRDSNNLVDAIADVKAENKEKKDAEATYEAVSSALREIQGLVIDNETKKIGSIKNKLESIITAANRLLEEIKEFERQ